MMKKLSMQIGSDGTVDCKGLNVDDYSKNPLVFLNHDYDKLIGRCKQLYFRGDSWDIEMQIVDEKYSESEFGMGVHIKEFHYDDDGSKVITSADLIETSAILPSNK